MVNRLPPLKRLLMQHAMGVLGDRPAWQKASRCRLVGKVLS